MFLKLAQPVAKIKQSRFVHSVTRSSLVSKNCLILQAVLINSTKNTAKNNYPAMPVTGCAYIKQKASKWTPFVLLGLTLFPSLLFANNCSVNKYHKTVQVEKVYDGDTLRLIDGRKLRLIGINTPERGQDGNRDEPYYQEAKDSLKQIVKNNKNKLHIVYGDDKYDRHKRLLAHIYTVSGENITATLIRKGLGFVIAVPPNTRLLGCYQEAEREAQQNQRGIWGHQFSQPIPVSALKQSARGFHSISGTVKRVGESRSAFWLNLDTGSIRRVALRVPKKHIHYFKHYHPKDLLHRKLLARGWIYKTKNEQRITIQHPASLKVLNTD